MTAEKRHRSPSAGHHEQSTSDAGAGEGDAASGQESGGSGRPRLGASQDPAHYIPDDPQFFYGVAGQLRENGRVLGQNVDVINSARAQDWSGSAAERYRGQLGLLRKDYAAFEKLDPKAADAFEDYAHRTSAAREKVRSAILADNAAKAALRAARAKKSGTVAGSGGSTGGGSSQTAAAARQTAAAQAQEQRAAAQANFDRYYDAWQESKTDFVAKLTNSTRELPSTRRLISDPTLDGPAVGPHTTPSSGNAPATVASRTNGSLHPTLSPGGAASSVAPLPPRSGGHPTSLPPHGQATPTHDQPSSGDSGSTDPVPNITTPADAGPTALTPSPQALGLDPTPPSNGPSTSPPSGPVLMSPIPPWPAPDTPTHRGGPYRVDPGSYPAPPAPDTTYPDPTYPPPATTPAPEWPAPTTPTPQPSPVPTTSGPTFTPGTDTGNWPNDPATAPTPPLAPQPTQPPTVGQPQPPLDIGPAPAEPAPAAPRVPTPGAGSTSGGGFDLGDGLWLAGGAAATIATGAIARKIWRDRAHPGTRLRTPSIVRRIRNAYRDTQPEQPLDPPDVQAGLEKPNPAGPRLPTDNHWPGLANGARAIPVGEHRHRSVALDLTAAPGLGIRGPAAANVIRALILTILAQPTPGSHHPAQHQHGQHQPSGRVVITERDAAAILGPTPPNPPPNGLRVVPDLDHALALIEDESHYRHTHPEHLDTQPLLVLVLAGPADPRHTEELQALLDHGRQLAIAALIHGDWPTGDALTLTDTNHVEATRGAATVHLDGVRIYSVPLHTMAELCSYLTTTPPPPTEDDPPAPVDTTATDTAQDFADSTSSDDNTEIPDESGEADELSEQRPLAELDPPQPLREYGRYTELDRPGALEEHDPYGELDEAAELAELDEPAEIDDPANLVEPVQRRDTPSEDEAATSATLGRLGRDEPDNDGPSGKGILQALCPEDPPLDHTRNGEASDPEPVQPEPGPPPTADDSSPGRTQSSTAWAGLTRPHQSSPERDPHDLPEAAGDAHHHELADQDATRQATAGDRPPLKLEILHNIHLLINTPHPDLGRPDGGAVITLGEMQAQLLTYLALHPKGVRRATVANALWPTTSSERPTGPLNTTLTRLRHHLKTLTPDTVGDPVETTSDGRLRLRPDRIEVDYWHYLALLDTAGDPTITDPTRASSYLHALTDYRGELAEDISADWITTYRQDLLHTVLKTATELAGDLSTHSHHREALSILDRARQFDPYNEPIYQKIMTVQHQAGHPEAAAHTYQLLKHKLGEVGIEPLPASTTLVTRDPEEPLLSANR